jgi:hypothetical protein
MSVATFQRYLPWRAQAYICTPPRSGCLITDTWRESKRQQQGEAFAFPPQLPGVDSAVTQTCTYPCT